MTRLSHWLDALGAASAEAASAEEAYRRNFARRVAELAEARAFAFRRANLVRVLAETVSGAEDEEAAVAHGLAILRTRLGWSSDSEARSEILSRFAPVCTTMFDAMSDMESTQPRRAEEPPAGGRLEARTDPAAALAAFETWYQEARGSAFWVLFENVIPETPLVDF